MVRVVMLALFSTIDLLPANVFLRAFSCQCFVNSFLSSHHELVLGSLPFVLVVLSLIPCICMPFVVSFCTPTLNISQSFLTRPSIQVSDGDH